MTFGNEINYFDSLMFIEGKLFYGRLIFVRIRSYFDRPSNTRLHSDEDLTGIAYWRRVCAGSNNGDNKGVVLLTGRRLDDGHGRAPSFNWISNWFRLAKMSLRENRFFLQMEIKKFLEEYVLYNDAIKNCFVFFASAVSFATIFLLFNIVYIRVSVYFQKFSNQLHNHFELFSFYEITTFLKFYHLPWLYIMPDSII